MHQSVLRFKRARWLKLASLLVAVSIALYAWHDPLPIANGGTWLGYTLGTIGAGLIAWLAWFGVRKRNYRSTSGTLQGWLSAHIYLGLALILVATLHTGFQFALNVHTLAYALMCLVIVSGVLGLVYYVRYPSLLSDNRNNKTQADLLEALKEADQQAVSSTNGLAPSFQAMVDSSIELTQLGGSLWKQLSGNDYSTAIINSKLVSNPGQREVIKQLASLLGDEDPQNNAQARLAIQSLNRRGELLQRLRQDIRIRALLDVWLLVHVPATIALLTALVAHIFIVFYYW
ncbi:MAG: hypothetical protein ACI9HX_000876 [Pseudoalteromonas tetraodonis]|jgi:hypothetical protein